MTTTGDRPTLQVKSVRVENNLPTSDIFTTQGLTPVAVYFPAGFAATIFMLQAVIQSRDGSEWSLAVSEYGGKGQSIVFPVSTGIITLLPVHLLLGVSRLFFNFDAGTPGDTTIYVYLRKFA